ncbi:MAG TPA: hypothetical protein VFB84_21070 [Micromonosporaceae bacterium]|nr:hypothetical protein [Micromonosporaceae bacterium]
MGEWMLTAGEITKLVELDKIGWPGELRGDALLLRLGAPLQPLVDAGSGSTVDVADQDSVNSLYHSPDDEWESFELRPRRMALCRINHRLRLGCSQAGAIGTLSHLARVGLATHVTSPWVLPGWDGYLTLELLNLGPAALRIHRGMPVARLVLFNMEGPVAHVGAHPYYGSESHLGSRYTDEFPSHGYQR